MTIDLPSLRSRIADLADRSGLRGVAIATVTPEHGPMVLCHGVAADGVTPVDAHTPFSVASSGKHVTAVAVLELAQAGSFDLYDAIGDHLTEIPASWADRPIVDLLHHTSGLPDYLADGGALPAERTRRAFFERYAALVPSFDAGEAWCYSNTNYILLGFLVAQYAGKPYPDALRARLFEPGGCIEVATGGPAIPDVGSVDVADVYERVEAVARRSEVAGDGDFVLSANGALSWERALRGDAILRRPARERMVATRRLKTGRSVPYGCGWFVDRVGGRACHHHAGHFDGWTAFFYRMPEADAAIYLMTDVALGNTRGQRHLAQVVLEALAPGTTPLSLSPPTDTEATLTRRTRAALIRREGPADPVLLGRELRVLVERVPGVRSMLNLWSGIEPDFTFVEAYEADGQRYRRYRLTYPERIEHVLVGYDEGDRMTWAWPV